MADKRGSVHCSGFLCKERATEHNHALKQGVPSHGFRIVSAVHLQLSENCGRDEGSEWFLYLPEGAVFRKLPGWRLPPPEITTLRAWVLLRFNQLRIAERKNTCSL